MREHGLTLHERIEESVRVGTDVTCAPLRRPDAKKKVIRQCQSGSRNNPGVGCLALLGSLLLLSRFVVDEGEGARKQSDGFSRVSLAIYIHVLFVLVGNGRWEGLFLRVGKRGNGSK